MYKLSIDFSDGRHREVFFKDPVNCPFTVYEVVGEYISLFKCKPVFYSVKFISSSEDL